MRYKILRAMYECRYKAWLLAREKDSLNEEEQQNKNFIRQTENSWRAIPDVAFTTNDKVMLVASCISSSENSIESVVVNYPNADKKATLIPVNKYRTKAEALLKESEKLTEQNEPPVFYKNAHCSECRFKEACYKKLKERDCLSLLPGMSAKVLAKYHSKGMNTITQISHLFRPRRRGRRPQAANGAYLWELKALAIREHKTFVIYPPQLDKLPARIYIDFEGLTDEGWIYLIGAVVCEDGKADEQFQFWASEQAHEQTIFQQLRDLLVNHPDASVFHYGSYEKHAIKQAAKKWDSLKSELLTLENRLVNLLSYFRTHVYPPTYGNGLKEIAGFLGFRWTKPEGDGFQSIQWRKQWETVKDDNLKQQLLQYNIEDCYALLKVHEWLIQLGESSKQDGVQRVSEMKNPTPFKFQSNTNFGEDFNVITKASYFDYQQSKIYWRNQRNTRQTSSFQKRDEKRHLGRGIHGWNPKKVNEVIVIPKRRRCPKCGHKKLYDCTGKVQKWKQTDLKFTSSGIKQWIVEYQSTQVKCAECWRHFNNGVVRRPIFGDNLFAWTTNLYVSYHISHEKISQLLEEQFGIWAFRQYFVDRQHRWWDKWQPEVNYLWEIIRKSPVIHIDETNVKLSKDRGYVWVFATPHTVFYHFTLTREPDFLKVWLDGYEGVIVTDSFAGYETLKVKQQKCLIHLIRDLNDDLFKNPFDEEYKDLVQEFGKLLRRIIETIDKYGLKKRHLNKHQIDVERFAERFFQVSSQSGLYVKYTKRLKKHWNEIWTFLNYDGVPWNNNNAEAAAKAFAQHRRGVNGQVSENGVRDYLKMLSIAQTCRYRKISFLSFLRGKAGIWENIPAQILPGYLPFNQARLYIHKQKFEHRKAWRQWKQAGKKPDFIPEYPDEIYRNEGWIDWYDWVGY